MNRRIARTVIGTLMFVYLAQADAAQIEAKGTAIGKVLGTTQAIKKTVTVDGKAVDVFLAQGKSAHAAVVQQAVYPPDCTHTWVIGLNAKKATVEQVRIVEYSCPHAKPATTDSFFSQYTGKGPANLKSLKDSVTTIAKATATCNLTTDAVTTAVKAVAILAKQDRAVAGH